MSIFFNFYSKIKEYILSFFGQSYLSKREMSIISNNDDIKKMYEKIDINKMNIEINIINNNFNFLTPIDNIIIFLKKEIRAYELGFQLQPEAFNHTNLLKKIELQSLLDNFRILKEIKERCLEF